MNIYSEYAIEHVTVYVRSMNVLEQKWKSNQKRVIETCIDTTGFMESYIVVMQYRVHRQKKQKETFIEEVKFVYSPFMK